VTGRPEARLREDAQRILEAGIAAADPRAAVLRALSCDGELLRVAGGETVELGAVGRVWIVGAGKAAAGMARGALHVLGDRVEGGTITVPAGGPARRLPGIDVWAASHPVPDTHGLAGAGAALEIARAAGEDDLVLCLLSGGASALWPAPPAGVSLSDLRATTELLLRAGAPIADVNAVRKHLSRIAGGWLARAAAPARLVTLAVSDVVGSAPDAIGSGPTVPDPTTFRDALEVLRRREVDVPPAVRAHLQRGDLGEAPETPKPGDPAFARASFRVVASNRDALAAAAEEAERLGYRTTVVGDDMEGEAREVAAEVAALAWGAHAEGESARAPAAFLLGGETTVTVRGSGRGGRSQELALAAALEIEGEPGVVVAAVGTDGRDGPTDAAGGMVDGETTARGGAAGVEARDALARNDAHTFLRASGDLVVTGPTGTNVNDLVLVLVG
jgi:hydroxypyruvate reductase